MRANVITHQLFFNGQHCGADKETAKIVNDEICDLWVPSGVDGHLLTCFSEDEVVAAVTEMWEGAGLEQHTIRIHRPHGPSNAKLVEGLLFSLSTLPAASYKMAKSDVLAILKPKNLLRRQRATAPYFYMCVYVCACVHAFFQ